MQPLNRIHFEIREPKKESDGFSRAAGIILNWLRTRKLVTQPNVIPHQMQNLESVAAGDGVSLEAILVEEENIRAWGIRFIHPDYGSEWLRWVTEITLVDRGDGKVCYSNSLQISRIGDYIAPVSRIATNPAVNGDLLAAMDGQTHYGFRLMPKPVMLKNALKDAALFTKVLESPERTHPIIYVTPDASGKHLIDYSKLAKDLAGMAHVVVAADHHATYGVGELLPKLLNCFDGGIRLYWPGFRRHSNPLNHPLLLGRDVRNLAAQNEVPVRHFIEIIAQTAAFTQSKRYATWSELESMKFREAVRSAKQRGDGEVLLALFEEDNRRQQQSLREAEEEISRLNMQLAEERSRADSLGQALRYQKSDADSPESQTLEVVETVADALRITERDFSTSISICLNGRSDRETPFARPEEVMKALSWLATTYSDAKAGTAPCPRLDLDFKNTLPAWDFRSSQSDLLANSKKFKDWYRTTLPDGRTVGLEPHLACGVSKDPRECIRIAFNWDNQTGKVVVGYIGQHQKNQNT
jgi:hypothetical protein